MPLPPVRILRRPVSDGALDLAVAASGDPNAALPVVLVHGMGSDHTTWRSLCRRLRVSGAPVVSMDLRGHGRSGHAASYTLDDFRDDLAFVVDELNLSKVDVVGHSLGAHAALRFAMADPGRVNRLVLEEVPPMPRDQHDADERITPAASLGERIRGVRALAANPLPVLRFDRSIPAKVAAEFESPDPSWWSDLMHTAASTLVISGGERSFLPPRHLMRLAGALPDASWCVIDAGHSVHRDRSAEFETTVLEFLRRD